MNFIRIGSTLIASTLLACCVQTAHGESAQEGVVRKTLLQNMGENAPIESVKKTGYSGLYEVRIGGDIFYTDEQAKFIFAGHILDSKTSKDFTRRVWTISAASSFPSCRWRPPSRPCGVTASA